MVYEPREDSYLIQKHIKHYAKGKVLDMGCGTGILGIEASKYAKVVCSDINDYALLVARQNSNNSSNIKFIHSDLFSNIQEKFDLIIFNPPYLPEDEAEDNETRLVTTGGKKGYELIEKFLKDAKDYLINDGKILLCFSSLTYKDVVDSILEKNNFKFEQIDNKKLFYEELFIYLIKK